MLHQGHRQLLQLPAPDDTNWHLFTNLLSSQSREQVVETPDRLAGQGDYGVSQKHTCPFRRASRLHRHQQQPGLLAYFLRQLLRQRRGLGPHSQITSLYPAVGQYGLYDAPHRRRGHSQ